MSVSPATGSTGDRWIFVDLERILNLPERLRRLWPAELLPHRNPPSRRSGEETGQSRRSSSRPPSAGAETEVAGKRREVDMLTAWVHGFAGELDWGSTRITIVVSSGVETVHLALSLGVGCGHAVLALAGEGLEDFSGYQLLRRIDAHQVAPIVEELAGLVEHDCVLTLSWAARGGLAGLEFLHRRDGAWFRPVIDRSADSVTIDADVEAGDAAVRTLLSAVLARSLARGVR